MKKHLILILSLLLCVISADALDYTPESLPTPDELRSYVIDPGHYLTPSQTSDLSSRLNALNRETTVGGAIAVIPSIGDMEINQFSTELFEKWGIGKKDNDNGFLIVIAIEQKQSFISTGYGLEGVLPDMLCSKILRDNLIPAMRKGDLYSGLDATLASVTGVLRNPDNKGEITSSGEREIHTLSSGELMEILGYICVTVFLLTLLIFIMDLRGGRRKSNYDKAIIWRRHILLYVGCTVFSLGLSLPLLLIAAWLSHRYRNKRIKCDTCGAKMKKLNEEEDNSMLSDSQDLEERLNTVDYDVWVCPECGTVERFPFKIKQSQYSECPNCHTIAQHIVCDKIIVPPTTRQPGIGERDYKCEYCGNRHNDRYRIEKKDDGAAAALLMGAALGAASRSHGGGGGGWSGPSGGGSTGGGGGGAGW